MPTQALGHHHFLCDLHPERGGSRCGARAWPKNSCAPPSPAAAQPSQGRRTRLQSPWAGPPLAGKADPLPNPKRGRAAGVAERPLPPPHNTPARGRDAVAEAASRRGGAPRPHARPGTFCKAPLTFPASQTALSRGVKGDGPLPRTVPGSSRDARLSAAARRPRPQGRQAPSPRPGALVPARPRPPAGSPRAPPPPLTLRLGARALAAGPASAEVVRSLTGRWLSASNRLGPARLSRGGAATPAARPRPTARPAARFQGAGSKAPLRSSGSGERPVGRLRAAPSPAAPAGVPRPPETGSGATFTALSPDHLVTPQTGTGRVSEAFRACCFEEFACLLVLTGFAYFLPELQTLSSFLHLFYPSPLSVSKPCQEVHSDLGRWEGPVKFSEVLGGVDGSMSLTLHSFPI